MCGVPRYLIQMQDNYFGDYLYPIGWREFLSGGRRNIRNRMAQRVLLEAVQFNVGCFFPLFSWPQFCLKYFINDFFRL